MDELVQVSLDETWENNGIEQKTFDYNSLSYDTRVFVQEKTFAIQARLKRAAEDIIAIGSDLKAVQERLRKEHEGSGYRGEDKGNGYFLAWLDDEFDMSQKTAYNFMAVSEKFGGKLVTVTSFPPRVLYALATAPDAVVNHYVPKENDTSKKNVPIPTLEDVKAAKEAYKKIEEAERKAREEAKIAQKSLLDKQDEIKELLEQFEKLEHEKQELEKAGEDQKQQISSEVRAKVEQETKAKFEKLKAKIKELTEQRDNLSLMNKKLSADLDAVEDRLEQELRNQQIRRAWRSSTEAIYKGINQFIGQLPSPIDAQILESDDWARLDQAIDTFQKAIIACRNLRGSQAQLIVEAGE